ncbi:MAG: DNRLRE domain-containing protein [Pseudomonadota bacterium]
MHSLLRAVAFVLVASGAHAAPVTFDVALTNRLTETSPDTAFPNLDDVTVDANDGGGETQALVSFEDLDLGVLGGGTLASAALRLFTNNPTMGTVSVHQLLVPFDDGTTWSDFGTDGVTLGTEAVASPADLLVAPADESLHSFDVTVIVQAWLDGAVPYGFVLLNDSSNGWDFDGADFDGAGPRIGPELVLDIEAPVIPLPAAGWLLLGGLSTLIVLRRRV